MAILEAIVENTMDCFGSDSVVFVAHKTPERENPARTVFPPSVFVSLLSLFLICIPLISCTKPEDGINPDEILAMLLDIPSIPTPPETEENSQNQGFLLTLGHCQNVAEYRYTAYEGRVQLFIDPDVITSVKQDSVTWSLQHSDGQSAFVLSVSTGDTLKYNMEWLGPAYQHYQIRWYGGWIVPATFRGYISSENGVPEIRWWQEDDRLTVSCLFLWSYVLVDSINGGGSIGISQQNTETFRAHWDAVGHGYYWAMGASGNW